MKNTFAQKLKAFAYFFTLILFSFNGFAQVGIGTTNPNANAKLDIVSTVAEPGGLLLPRVALTATDNFAPLTAHVAGMTVYNTATTTGVNMVTPGYYYNDGGQWVRIAAASVPSSDWTVAGNAGLNATNNFLGTTDAVNLRFRTTNIDAFEISSGDATARGKLRAMTNGTAALPVYSFTNSATTGLFSPGANTLAFSTTGAERMRVLSDGRITINSTDAYSFMLNSSASGTNGAIIGASVNGTAVQGQASGNGNGVSGFSSASPGFGVVAVHFGATGTGLLASGNNSSSSTYLNTGTGSASTGRDGALGIGTLATGTGVIGTGNNSTHIVVNSNGGGIAGSGTRNGVFGYAGNGARDNSNLGNAAGVFMLDTDNNTDNNNSNNNDGIRATAILASFDNIAFNARGGASYSARDSYFGGYFSGGTQRTGAYPTAYAYVGLRYRTNNDGTGDSNTTDFKIVGPGNVATLINDDQNVPRIMFAPEAPEIVFQDYGMGQLVNGQATILLDPILKKSLHIDSKHPLKVFVTLEGDCNGVYVTSKSADGFTVKELQNGTSNVPFSWQIVANRADTKDRSGNVVSKHVGLRLPVGPGPINAETKQLELKTVDQKDSIKKHVESVSENVKQPSISSELNGQASPLMVQGQSSEEE